MIFGGNFWTHDYISGVERLLERLDAGSVETRGVLEFIRARITAERDFSSILAFAQADKRVARAGGAGGAPGAASDALDACVEATARDGARHLAISQDLDQFCYEPLAAVHSEFQRTLKSAEANIRAHYTPYAKLRAQTAKHRAEPPRASTPGESTAIDSAMSTLRLFKEKYTATPSLVGLQSKKKITLAGISYRGPEALDLLRRVTAGAKMGNYRAMLVGTYENVSTGAAVASSSRRFLKNDSVAYSDKFGQSLVDAGLLKPVAQLSNKFLNSPTSYYQWQPGLIELLDRRAAELEGQPSIVLSPPQEIDRAVSPGLAADTEAYIQSILELDMHRCALELEISKAFDLLEECELRRISTLHSALERYKAICAGQDVTPSASPSASPSAPPSAWAIEHLKEFARAHRSGPFVPTVAAYHGPNGTVCQTFGVELEKTLFFPELVLQQLAELPRPPLETWTRPYSLENVYRLRSQVNTGRKFNESIFRFFSTEIISGTLLQYFLELPESVIPFTLYDHSDAGPASILRSLRPENRTTLKHFLGYLRGYNAPKELGPALAHYLFRPRAVSALTMDNHKPGRLLTRLLCDYDELFEEAEEQGLATPPVMSPPLLAAGFRTISPRPGALSPDGNRPRTHSGSALETTNGTHLIPLSLSPDLASLSPKQEVRHGLKLSGFLPIGGMLGSPQSRKSPATPSKLRMQQLPEAAGEAGSHQPSLEPSVEWQDQHTEPSEPVTPDTD